jgi:hypothetical protein
MKDFIKEALLRHLPPKPERNGNYLLPKDCVSVEIDSI